MMVSLVLDLAPFAEHWKRGVAFGLALALVLASASGLAIWAAGIPNLSPNVSAEPGAGWEKAPNPLWTNGGKPVVFFYGSVACPFCSASSWAIYASLAAFGSWSGTSYSSSNPGDTYPNTPEVSLAGASLSSAYLSWDGKEGSDRTQISEPPVSLTEQAYLNAYSNGIPFLVIGGTYIHTGSIVSPVVLQGQTAAQVAQSLSSANPSDPVYSSIESQVNYLEAYLAKCCQAAGLSPPASVTSNTSVAAIMTQI
jgi:hypothetical protein